MALTIRIGDGAIAAQSAILIATGIIHRCWTLLCSTIQS